jgi:hypothetical protein
MANGDLAASVGYPTVAGGDDIREGYDEDNVTRDLIAAHRLTGTHSASQIASGTLPVARGGTGRNAPYSATSATGPHPTTRRILVVDNENVIYAATGDIAPQYIGFRLHVQNLTSLNFPTDGDLAEPHGAPFTPLAIFVQVRLDHDSAPVDVFPRATSPSWNSENVFLRAKWMSTGEPFDGLLSRVDLFCFGVA